MEIEEGSIYGVDHSMLPRSSKIPASLAFIQAVRVDKKSDKEVTIIFPSNESLNKFFNDEKFNGAMQPNMDAKFSMGLYLSKKLLTHKIPFEEFAALRGTKIFWVPDDHDNNDSDFDDNDVDTYEEEHSDEKHSNGGLDVKWRTRLRTRVISKKDNESKMIVKDCCDEGGVKDEEKVDIKEMEEKPRILRKRKCGFKGVKYGEKKRKYSTKAASNCKKFIDSRHRWTVERYKMAEENMLKIMKERRVGPVNPMLRPDLRAEARKMIGDTGLLDHLLKHMAGKLAPGGKERFRRRHNPEGAMEYWVESAELLEVRKKAGIDDPYWVPPAGWKPGDCPNLDPACAAQLQELREEVASIKGEIGELSKPEYVFGRLNFEGSLKPLKEMYEELMKKKAYIENQLLQISYSFAGMEEDLEKVKVSSAPPTTEAMSQQEAAKQTKTLAEIAAEQDKGNTSNAAENTINGSANTQTREDIHLQPKEPNLLKENKEPPALALTKEERRQKLKSGFRICKPQGTFLWPSQMSSSSNKSQVVVHLDDLLGCPTPPSVSSSSSRTAPLIFPPPACHHQQQKQLASVVRPVATRAAVTLTFSTATTRGSTTTESISSPILTASRIVHSFVPDLNQFPLTT